MNSLEAGVGGEAVGSETESAFSSPGAQLYEAREARGLSRHEAAQALKLSVRQIQLLEEGDWSALQVPPVVARGFVRNYARLLGIQPEPLVAQIEVAPKEFVSLGTAQPTGVAMPSPIAAKRRDLASMMMAVALALGAALAFFLVPDAWWSEARVWMNGLVPAGERTVTVKPLVVAPGDTRQADREVASVKPSESNSHLPATAVASVPESARQLSAAVEVNASQAPVALELPVPLVADVKPAEEADAAEPGKRVLVFEFQADSWVEVRSQDRVLYSQLNTKGGHERLSFKPPIHLTIGNAHAVALTVDGKVRALNPSSQSSVARVSID